MARVVFSIDNVHEPRNLMRFLRHMDSFVAQGKAKEILLCLGSFEGKREISFLCEGEDFTKYVEPYGFTLGQSCYLVIPENLQAYLIYRDGVVEPKGIWSQVTEAKDYTYVFKDETLWSTV